MHFPGTLTGRGEKRGIKGKEDARRYFLLSRTTAEVVRLVSIIGDENQPWARCMKL